MSKVTDEQVNEFLKSKGYGNVEVEGVGEGKGGKINNITINIDHAIDNALLKRAIAANEVGTSVLLWNLEIEHQLRLFLKGYAGLSSRDTNNYNTLVLMLKACRFDNDIYQIVNNFRKLRNKFAHEKDASLEKNDDILRSIFSCDPPSPTTDKVDVVDDFKGNKSRLKDLEPFSKLSIYANFVVIFLATASKVYDFPKPYRKLVISTTKSEPQ